MDKFREINSDSFHSNFINISIETIEKWEKVLLNGKTEFTRLLGNNLDLEALTSGYSNRKEVRNDCDRSRMTDRIHLPDFGCLLEQLLILYCKTNNVPYKQGMNEIMSPLIFLKVNFNISNSRIFNLFSCFVDNFLTNYYYELELYAFRSSVSLLTLLLRYHDPGLVISFEHGGVSPQMYATNWLLTTYANKLQLGIVYKLWDIMIDENDQLFIHFVVIAFLQYKRKLFIDTDSSEILMSFSKIKIESMTELKEIVTIAKRIRMTTPFSFRILVQKLEIFKPRSNRLKELYTKFNTDEMIALPILSSELLYIMYSDQINCPDSQCQKYVKYPISEANTVLNQEEDCYYSNLKENLNKQYVVVDLRISKSDDDYVNEGSLPMKSLLSIEDLNRKDIDITTLIDEKLSQYKTKPHIILITNDTLYFARYEQKYFREKTSFNMFLSSVFGKSQKAVRELNEKEVQNLMKNKAKIKKRIKLKEYENIKKIIDYLQEKECPHVSYVYGGFKEVHELSVKHSIKLINHNNEKCELCHKNKSKNERIELFYQIYGGKPRSNSTQNKINDSFQNIGGSDLKDEFKDSVDISNDEDETNNDEPDRYAEPTDQMEVERMSEHIKDPLNKVFHCLLMKHNKHEYKDKVVLILNFDSMRLYKMIVNKANQNSNSKVVFGMLDFIRNYDIKKYKRNKSIFKIEYNRVKYQDEDEVILKEYLTLDLFSDADSENFTNELNEIISIHQSKKGQEES